MISVRQLMFWMPVILARYHRFDKLDFRDILSIYLYCGSKSRILRDNIMEVIL